MPEFEIKAIDTVVHNPSDWNLWIYLPGSRLTLYKWVFSPFIQRPRRISETELFTHPSPGEILAVVWIQSTASVLTKNSVSTVRVMSILYVYNYKRNRGDGGLRRERHVHTVNPYLFPLALIVASIAVPCMRPKLCWGESLLTSLETPCVQVERVD